MSISPSAPQNGSCKVPFDEPLRIAMQMLVRARQFAQNTSSSQWEFAVEIVELQRAGVSTSELRWLLKCNYAIHAQELSPQNGSGRRFRRLEQNVFPPGTCFVLSDLGMSTLQELSADTVSVASKSPNRLPRLDANSDNQPQQHKNFDPSSFPKWDAARRQLCFRNLIVKQFRCHAPNQETIIAAFQTEAWAARIDDPLPVRNSNEPRRRLHDTIKCLNRNQVNRLLRFRGDGSGSGILWEPR